MAIKVENEANQLLVNQIFAIYSHAETVMLDKMAKRVAKGILQEGWTESKLKETTEMKQELEDIVKDLDKIAKHKLDKGLKEAYITGQKSVGKDMGIPMNIMNDFEVPASLQRLILESNNMITNTSIRILRDTQDAFREIQAEVATGLLAGVETRKEIAQSMLNKLADKGITSFVDKAGRKWDMATYAEMAARTVTARAALQGHIDRQAEIGNDLMIVSSIGVTCPTCAPWEGKVLSISGKDFKYTPLQTAIAAGLFHPNCKHTLTAYFDFIEEPEGHDHQQFYEPEIYAKTQEQRYNERQIRRWKRRAEVAITPQDRKAALSKVMDFQERQRELVQKYGFKRKYDRESIRNMAGIKGMDKKPAWTKGNIKMLRPVVKQPKLSKKEMLLKTIDELEEVNTKGMPLKTGWTKSNIYDKALENDFYEITDFMDKANLSFFDINDERILAVDDFIGKNFTLKKDVLKSVVNNDINQTLRVVRWKGRTYVLDGQEVAMIAKLNGQSTVKGLYLNLDKEKSKFDKLTKENIKKAGKKVKGGKVTEMQPMERSEVRKSIDDSRQYFNLPENGEIKQAFVEYTGSAYGWMNDFYRSDMELSQLSRSRQPTIKNMEKGFKKIPNAFERDVELYRATGFSYLKNADAEDLVDRVERAMRNYSLGSQELLSLETELRGRLIDTVVTEKSFTSTAYKYGAFGSSKPVQLKINAPLKNSKSVQLAGISQFGDSEAEILFAPGMDNLIEDVRFEKSPSGYGTCLRITVKTLGHNTIKK